MAISARRDLPGIEADECGEPVRPEGYVSHFYNTFKLPKEPSACADAQMVLNAALGLRSRLETLPDNRNRSEAIERLDKLVMVAMGAFGVHPR